MAKTELDDELEEESGGGFSRFLFFVTPILFTVVLLGVLLTLFNINFRNTLISIGNDIPIIKNLVPDPEPSGAKDQKTGSEKKQEESTDATVKKLKDQLAKQSADLQASNKLATDQESKMKKLQDDLNAAQQQKSSEEQATRAESYQKEVKKLAQLYSEMSPSKAAAIFDKLTEDETLQMLSIMSSESKVAILEKMDPQKAADISIKLKDVKPADDLAIAALQSRLKKEAASSAVTSTGGNGLDEQQLKQTFSTMSAEAAAKLVLQTYKVSPDKALKIMKSVDDSTRSKILASMTESDEKASVKILNLLLAK
ncbi:MotE family protein [Paenibacillus puldeungensis]|uniref:MotE family protein n=1 Tax=Paenibacillus puldeungensis TaxID=696536 RepID=A0ABW3RXD8_9BACL